MIPQKNNLNIIKKTMPSKTYDLNTGRILDGIDALKQAIILMLSVERYAHIIYSFRYGFECEGVYGGDIDYVKMVLQSYIRNALIIDDRINDVVDFECKQKADELQIMFTVKSIYGNIAAEKVVRV